PRGSAGRGERLAPVDGRCRTRLTPRGWWPGHRGRGLPAGRDPAAYPLEPGCRRRRRVGQQGGGTVPTGGGGGGRGRDPRQPGRVRGGLGAAGIGGAFGARGASVRSQASRGAV